MASEKSSKRESSALNWVFTYNNYTPQGEKQIQECELFKFVVYGHEVAPTTGTLHLQGYFQLQKKKTHTYLKKRLPKMFFEKAIADYKSNSNYCSKDATDIFTHGTPTINGSNTAQLHQQILNCDNWQDVLKLPNIERRIPFAREVFMNKPIPKQEGVKLLSWQKIVVDTLLNNKPDDRHIYVVYDEKGSKGKTFLAKYLYTNFNAYYTSPSKSADILYAYNGQTIILYDIPRSCDEDYVNWGAIEKLKDGIFFSGKFASGTKYRQHKAHIVIFTNHPIPEGKFSEDRLIYIDLKEEQNKFNKKGSDVDISSTSSSPQMELEGELIPSTLDYYLNNKQSSKELTHDEYDEIEMKEQLPTHDEDFVLRFD